jgi:cytochrome b involved in lipid metabolism
VSADSWLFAILTSGEGYHNYHHEFQHDYRNGVKPWQIDPTKWIIWIMSKVGLVSKLRRVPTEKLVLAELAEAQRRLEATLANPGLTEPLPLISRTLATVCEKPLNTESAALLSAGKATLPMCPSRSCSAVTNSKNLA